MQDDLIGEIRESISDSTTSSESSISYLSLSDKNSQQLSLPFQNNAKSVALCYYHHLFNQKKNSKNLLPLYNYTYASKEKCARDSKFSEYDSSRFNTKKNNFSGNYSTMQERQVFDSNLTIDNTNNDYDTVNTVTEKSIEKILSTFFVEPKKASYDSNSFTESKVICKPPQPNVLSPNSIRSNRSAKSANNFNQRANSQSGQSKPYSNEFIDVKGLDIQKRAYFKSCSPYRMQTSSPNSNNQSYRNQDSFGNLFFKLNSFYSISEIFCKSL